MGAAAEHCPSVFVQVQKCTWSRSGSRHRRVRERHRRVCERHRSALPRGRGPRSKHICGLTSSLSLSCGLLSQEQGWCHRIHATLKQGGRPFVSPYLSFAKGCSWERGHNLSGYITCVDHGQFSGAGSPVSCCQRPGLIAAGEGQPSPAKGVWVGHQRIH